MTSRDLRITTQLPESSSKASAFPLLDEWRGGEDFQLDDRVLHSSRRSGEYASSNRPDHTSTDSSINEKYFFRRAAQGAFIPTCQRLVHSMRPLFMGRQRRLSKACEEDLEETCHAPYCVQKHGRRPRLLRCTVVMLAIAFMVLGIFQCITVAFGAFATLFPDYIDWAIDTWGDFGQPSEGLSHWPTDFTGDIRPVACHSHNDYLRKIPLFSAIRAGCIGVEADVWLFDEELYVGHSTSALTPNRTLRNLYINPLLDLLDKQNPITHFQPNPETHPNGVFATKPSQMLVLLIDFKTSGPPLWPVVYSQLDALRERGYLTHFNGTDVVEGPLTIVATGNAPFDLLMANHTYRDVFFDAPLDEMAATPANRRSWQDSGIANVLADDIDEPISGAEAAPLLRRSFFSSNDQGQSRSRGAPNGRDVYNQSNSYYASVSFTQSIGHVWRSRLSSEQLKLVREQIHGAHSRRLKVRYWGLPSWPRGLRNHVWHVLIREGVDVLNVDDLVGATRRDWRRRKGWWY